MSIAHILKNLNTDNIDVNLKIYVEDNKSFVKLSQEGRAKLTVEINDEDDLMKAIDLYMCDVVLDVPIDISDSDVCFEKNKPQYKKWGIKKISRQLSVCKNCIKFSECESILVLINRLAELKEGESNNE